MKNFPTQAFIGGELTDAASGATFDSLAPGSGELLAKVAAGDAEDVDRAVGAARKAFDSGVWAEAAPADRKKVLLGFAELIEANAAELAHLDAVDAGKPITDCEDLDIPDVIATSAGTPRRSTRSSARSPDRPRCRRTDHREPIGVVGAVLPWNFPAAMVVLEGRAGPRLGLLRGDQAARAGAPVDHPHRRAGDRGRRARGCPQRRPRPRRGRGPGARPARGRRRHHLHRLGRGGARIPPLLGRLEPQAGRARARRQEPADRPWRRFPLARQGGRGAGRRGLLERGQNCTVRLADPRSAGAP